MRSAKGTAAVYIPNPGETSLQIHDTQVISSVGMDIRASYQTVRSYPRRCSKTPYSQSGLLLHRGQRAVVKCVSCKLCPSQVLHVVIAITNATPREV